MSMLLDPEQVYSSAAQRYIMRTGTLQDRTRLMNNPSLDKDVLGLLLQDARTHPQAYWESARILRRTLDLNRPPVIQETLRTVLIQVSEQLALHGTDYEQEEAAMTWYPSRQELDHYAVHGTARELRGILHCGTLFPVDDAEEAYPVRLYPWQTPQYFVTEDKIEHIDTEVVERYRTFLLTVLDNPASFELPSCPASTALWWLTMLPIDHAAIVQTFLDRAEPLVDFALLASQRLSPSAVQVIYDRSFSRGHPLDYRVRAQLALNRNLTPAQKRSLWLDDDVRVRGYALTSGWVPDEVMALLVEDPAITVGRAFLPGLKP